MRFDTATFWLFFLVAWTCWRRLPFDLAKRVTLCLSLLFYGWWNAWYLVLILASTLVDFTVGARLHASAEPATRRRWLLLSLVTNLGLLAAFKYTPFAVHNLEALTGMSVSAGMESLLARWVVPVGISFYTFQTLSYTVDIYRGQLEPARRFTDFFLYVSFFPQLVAGPIVRARELLPQFRRRRRLLPLAVQRGLYLCVWGMFMKVVVADNLAPAVDPLFEPGGAAELSPVRVWLGTGYFCCQAFADFAGYSAIAIGCAYLLGLRFPVNFNFPFIARGPGEFWRRWHMSLSHWLRDYVYIPLGGSRGAGWRTSWNLWLTMVLCGLWHGAAWHFVLFGAVQGAALALERVLRGPRRHTERDAPPATAGALAVRLLEILLLLLFSQATFVLFRTPDLATAMGVLERMYVAPFHEALGLSDLGQARHLLLCLPVVGVHLGQLLHEWYGARITPRRQAMLASVMLFLLLVFSRGRGDAFLYFQF